MNSDVYQQLLIGVGLVGLWFLTVLVIDWVSNASISRNRLRQLHKQITDKVKQGVEWPLMTKAEAEEISRRVYPISAYTELVGYRSEFETILKAVAAAREMSREQRLKRT